MLVVEWLLIGISVALGVAAIRAEWRTTSAALLVYASALQNIGFATLVLLRLYPAEIAHFWQFRNLAFYEDRGAFIPFFFTALSLIGYFIGRTVAYRVRRQNLKIRQLTRLALAGTYFKVISILFLLVFTPLLLWHSLEYDWGSAWHYVNYLAPRSDPGLYGIDSEILRLVHRIIPYLGIVAAAIISFSQMSNRQSLKILVIPIFMYLFLVTLSFVSRMAALQLLILSLAFFKSPIKIRRIFAVAIVVIGAFCLYVGVLRLRRLAPSRAGNFGVGPLIEVLRHPGELFEEVEVSGITMFLNVASGGINLGEALVQTSVHYPLRYKILSFSPLLSSIDGFGSVAYYSEINRAGPTGPFGAFSEAYLFGWLGMCVLLAVLLVVVWYGTKASLTLASPIAYIPSLFFGIVLSRLYFYPIRNSFRLMLAVALVSLLLRRMLLLKSNRRKTHPKLVFTEIDNSRQHIMGKLADSEP